MCFDAGPFKNYLKFWKFQVCSEFESSVRVGGIDIFKGGSSRAKG